jgi:pilus assembly protein Flp/PilA
MFHRMYARAQTWLAHLRSEATEQEGATAVEYALMVALIAAVIIVAVAFLGHSASNTYSTVGSALDAVS